jgi:hypothetical protein
MRYLKALGLVGVCLFSASYAHAQRVVVGFGVGPTYVGAAPGPEFRRDFDDRERDSYDRGREFNGRGNFRGGYSHEGSEWRDFRDDDYREEGGRNQRNFRSEDGSHGGERR